MIDISRLKVYNISHPMPIFSNMPYFLNGETQEILKLIKQISIIYSITFYTKANYISLSYGTKYMDSSSSNIINNCNIKLLKQLYELNHIELQNNIKNYIINATSIKEQYNTMSKEDKIFVEAITLSGPNENDIEKL